MKKILFLLLTSVAFFLLANTAWAGSEEITVVRLTFSNGVSETWPFETPARSMVGVSKDKSRNNYGKGLLNSTQNFVTKDGYVFKFHMTNYLCMHQTLGLRYEAVGDAIEFPVVPGKTLAVITLTNGSVRPTDLGCPEILTSNDETVFGGSAVDRTLESGEKWSWKIMGEAEKPYKMSQSTDGAMTLRELELIYVTNSNIPIAIDIQSGNAEAQSTSSVTLSGSFKVVKGTVKDFKAGFETKKAGESIWNTINSKLDKKCNFTATVNSLERNTIYLYRPWVQTSGHTRIYGPVKTFVGGIYSIELDFTKEPCSTENIIYDLPTFTHAVMSCSGKECRSKFGTAYDFKFWGVSGVGKFTVGGAVQGLVLNPMKNDRNQAPVGQIGNAWIELPAIKEGTVKSVNVTFHTCRGMMNVSSNVNRETGEGTKDYSPNIEISNREKSVFFDIAGAEEGKPFYICVEDACNVVISKINIAYTLK